MSIYITDDPLRIVRPAQRGEMTPSFSTADLLLGMRFPATPTPTRKPGPATGVVHAGIRKTSETRSNRAFANFTQHYETVKEMLSRFATNVEIAKATGLTVSQISDGIQKFPDLKTLSVSRASRRSSKGGQATAAISRAKYEANKAQILDALKTQPLSTVACKYNMCYRSLEKYLSEDRQRKREAVIAQVLALAGDNKEQIKTILTRHHLEEEKNAQS